MSLEPEHYLKEAARVTNVRSKNGRLMQTAKRYLRKGERQRREEEKNRLEQMLNPLNVQISKMSETNVSEARRARDRITMDLEDYSPPTDLSGAARDAIAARSKELEAEIKVGMLSTEEMRRNPVGAVDRHMKWEKANKDKILEWKNHQLLLNPESEEQDLCNIEKFRPSMATPGQPATFMPEAQIGGHFAMSPQAKDNWPENMPEYGEVNSPWRQAMMRERVEMQAQIDALQAEVLARRKPGRKKRLPGEKRPWTCDYEGCGKEVDLRHKGVHIAAHTRMDKQLAEAEAALNEREAKAAS